MKRDLLDESQQAVGILDYTLKQVSIRQQRFGHTPNPSEVAELYNALSRAMNIAHRLASQSLRPVVGPETQAAAKLVNPQPPAPRLRHRLMRWVRSSAM